ncbi:MAG TPA: methyltransferase [Phycisphaerae bacterium]|nr:hypothetical protein [Phycisphaerales bacterium]HRX84067.1 methyltransferase [Phycisphaerae bacterium]
MSFRKLRIRLIQLAFVPVAFLVVFVRPNWGVESPVAYVMELAGYAFLLAGLGIRVWSILYIGGRKSQGIVSDGPYSLCRNPLYVGTMLLAVGVGLCFENVLVLVAAVAILLPIHYLAARLEENNLALRFPAEYAAYAATTPRFWPRWRGYRSPATVAVSTRAIRRVMIDTVAVLMIPQIEDLLEMLHDHHVVHVLWHFP